MNLAHVQPAASRPLPAWTAKPLSVRRTRSQDIEQHTQQQHDWQLDYDQLDAGRFQGQFTDVRLPGVQLFLESTSRSVRQRGALNDGAVGVGIMLHGRGDLIINGVRAGVTATVACNATELDICTPPDCQMAGAMVDTQLLHDAAQALGGLDRRFMPGSLLAITPPEPVVTRWRQVLLGAVQAALDPQGRLDDAAVRQRLLNDLLFSLVDLLASGLEDERVHRPDHRKLIVDRAIELMLSRADEPPSLLEVCQRVGASPRKLGYCFQDSFGISPGRYIKTIRLNAVRRALCRADDPRTTVYDVAARWGFWHFGHFSADYKKLFAELPSETLSRARAAQSP